MFKKLAAAFAAAVLFAPLVAQAQDVPSYAQTQDGVERIGGRITNFDGQYSLTVRDERGYIDNVRIHPGTIINPTGITLAPGMVVSIIGENDGDYFSGDEIDTPYNIYGGVPYYDNHPWTYYGSGFALGLFFGSVAWWHGDYFGGYGYGWNNGYRVYHIPHYRFGAWGGPGGYHGGPGYGGYRGYHGGPGAYHGGYRNGSVHINNSVNVINHTNTFSSSTVNNHFGRNGGYGGYHGYHNESSGYHTTSALYHNDGYRGTQGVRAGGAGGGHYGGHGAGGFHGGGGSHGGGGHGGSGGEHGGHH